MILSLVFILPFAMIGTGEIWTLQNIQSVGTLTLSNGAVPVKANHILKCYTVAKCFSQCLIVEGAKDLMAVYVPLTGMCYCNPYDTARYASSEKYDVISWHPSTSEKSEVNAMNARRVTVWPYQPDCKNLYITNHTEDAVYTIQPPGTPSTTDAWCDMTNGGWTVVQRRKDGSENFNRGWDEYVAGFGNRTGEYWLGLENMHHLTKGLSDLFIQLEAFPGNQPQNVNISVSWTIDGFSDGYGMHFLNPADNCGEDMYMLSSFSTFDQDTDTHPARNCAAELRGGWWFRDESCEAVNLNGVYYQQGESGNTSDGIRWNSCFDKGTSLKATVMKTRHQLDWYNIP